MHRRTFLQSSAAALGGLAAFGPALAASRSDIPARIGVALYTVRDIFPGDFVGVLEAIKRIGYDEVEIYTYYEREPRVVRAVLEDIGLSAPSAHFPIERFRSDLDGILETAKTVGHRYVVVPWIHEPDRPTGLDGYRRLAEELNGWGARAQDAGLRLAYHHHDFEFETFGGETPGIDALLEASDPDLVDIELDLYWTTYAGYDPLAYIERFPGRFPLWHVKDHAADGSITAVGSGTIDFARIFDRAEQAGLEHAFVEQDNASEQPAGSLGSIEASFAYLEDLRS